MKAILFDFDGVVVDSERSKIEALNRMLNKKGHHPIKMPFSDFVGKKTDWILQQEYPTMPDFERACIVNERRQNTGIADLVPGIKEVLVELKKSYKIGLVTGTEKALVQPTLAFYRLADYFDIMVTGEDFTKSKPDPECYLFALAQLNFPRQTVLAIEDSQAGIDAAKCAGIKVFGLETYGKLRRADKFFKTHYKILDELSRRP
jgi:HAD superfamily hydrolase (TIGR01509 family)